MYTVACMKWGDKYGPEYVNRLYNMVERNTTLPFKFICFTDNADGLLPEVSVRPLPDMPLPPDKERGWRKLSLFRDDVGLEGRVLFLDLDVVIVGNIDGFFTIDGDFIFIRHWKPSVKQGVGQTAVYRFEAGKLKFLYDDFIENMQKIKSSFPPRAGVCKRRNVKEGNDKLLARRMAAEFQIHLHVSIPP